MAWGIKKGEAQTKDAEATKREKGGERGETWTEWEHVALGGSLVSMKSFSF